MYLHPIILIILAIIIAIALVLIVTLIKDRNDAIKMFHDTLKTCQELHSIIEELADTYLSVLKELHQKEEQLEDLHLRNAELSAAYSNTAEGKTAAGFDAHVDEALAVSAPSPEEIEGQQALILAMTEND